MSSPSRESKNGEWLIEIANTTDEQHRDNGIEKTDKQEGERKRKPRIQTVAHNKSDKTPFCPSVAKFGPYHHTDSSDSLNKDKNLAARWFISLATGKRPANSITPVEAKTIYNNFFEAATKSCPSPTDCYIPKIFSKPTFMRMMFLDGCFILHFIHLVVRGSNDLSETSHLNRQQIVRDMFLLENQIPYTILETLISLLPGHSNESNQRIEAKDMDEFIEKIFFPRHEFPSSSMTCLFSKMFPGSTQDSENKGEQDEVKPLHLLDSLRSKLIGKGIDDQGQSPPFEGVYWHHFVRPVMELKEAGIELSRGHGKGLKSIEFKQGRIYGHLKLPKIMVDDATKTLLLNLIAYEMCPDGLSDRMVISFICFLDSLIYNTDDVKELRSKNILLNCLGSDKEVVDLFKGLASNLTPNYSSYTHVMSGIKQHTERRFNHSRVWIGRLMLTHFTSPWTAISFLAAIFLILLSVVQTVYSILSFTPESVRVVSQYIPYGLD